MGCDIHVFKEKKVGNVWMTADEWETEDYGDGDIYHGVPFKTRFTDRNYQLFGVLSKGVRGYEYDWSFEPRGIPFNMSFEVARANHDYGDDGHSHSYLYLHELKELREFLDAATVHISGMKDADGLAALNASLKTENPNYDLIFPYCQMTTDQTALHFEFDIPASHYLGQAVDKLISQFYGVEGENHRIVFFFDN